MENVKNKKLAIAILAILLVSSIAMISNLAFDTASAQDDYGDLLQYDWPTGGHDESRTRFSEGPALTNPDLLWESSAPGSLGAVTAFDGKVFVISLSTLYAFDAFNGQLAWQTDIVDGSFSPDATGGVTKLDDEYLYVDTSSGIACYKIATGDLVWAFQEYPGGELKHGGTGGYYPGAYSSTLKLKYLCVYDKTSDVSSIIALDLSDPSSSPPIAWSYICSYPSEILAFGDGRLFLGSRNLVYALNGTTGDLLWESQKIGLAAQGGLFYDGKLYHDAGSTRITVYNATNGNILWEYEAGAGFAWFAYTGAAGYGRYIHQNVGTFGRNAFIGCWNAETGETLWKLSLPYCGSYIAPILADGKVYVEASDLEGYSYMCIDAFTGAALWRIPYALDFPAVAYGNLYGISNDCVYCFGSPSTPTSWSYFRGNINTPGVVANQSAPEELNVKWEYTTGGAVTSSPAVVDAKVYVGSYDQNIYCLDAYTGSKIWTFPTEYRIESSVAVAGGRVYTGADDGYVYCIDADTGAEVWKTNIYAGNVPGTMFEVSTWGVRSSPIVIGNRLYVGALDGQVYCLNTADGDVEWTYETGGPIGGSPAYSDGAIFIASTDRNVYALDASTGTEIWTWTTPKGWGTTSVYRSLFLVGTPVVGEGKVFIGGGGRSVRPRGVIFVALNATTGDEVWMVDTDPSGNSNQPFAATYLNGVLYMSENNGASARNATTGALIWSQWLGFQVFSSVAYAGDPSGAKVYVGCDSYAVTCLNATSGEPLSVYVTGAQVPSSPAIYDGKLYVGSNDGKVYCFDDSPMVSTEIWAESNKGATMWNNETLEICGQITAIASYVNPVSEVEELYYPGLPNATINLSLTTPGGDDVPLTATTDNTGAFSFSYSPTEVGEWGWVVYYDGEEKSWITYASAYGEWNAADVTSSIASGDTEPPPEDGVPMEYVYAAVAVIVIVLVAVGIYVFMKRGK